MGPTGPVPDTRNLVQKTGDSMAGNLQIYKPYALSEYINTDSSQYAGASYHSGVGASDGNTLPALSSLPGSKIAVLAAQSRQRNEYAPEQLVTTWGFFWLTIINRTVLHEGISDGSFFNMGYFAFNDFPDATASMYTPALQCEVLHYEQAVLFAIQHA